MDIMDKARELLKGFKGNDYVFGLDVLDQIGSIAAAYGKKVMVVANNTFLKPIVEKVVDSLKSAGLNLAGDRIVPDAAPNAPREDVYRIESYILHFEPDCIVSIGGGSAIDATKAANALAALGPLSPEIDEYFGTGLVKAGLDKLKTDLLPLIAVETSSSSGAHLTKYSNITNPVLGQKKLIVDDAIIPAKAVFDYSVTTSMPVELTVDGALDGIAHCIEVFYGISADKYDKLKEITETALKLIVKYTPEVVNNPDNREAREAIGMATDLGGYAIMLGGTNGAHLTSFSLVDVTTHGRACGIMNPYYSIFFSSSIEKQLLTIGQVFKDAGFLDTDLNLLKGRKLGEAVATGMISFSKSIQCPVTLGELPGFTDAHIEKALNAAKNPQLKMKLQNMPVKLTAEMVDEYMGTILRAAKTGNFALIKTYE